MSRPGSFKNCNRYFGLYKVELQVSVTASSVGSDTVGAVSTAAFDLGVPKTPLPFINCCTSWGIGGGDQAPEAYTYRMPPDSPMFSGIANTVYSDPFGGFFYGYCSFGEIVTSGTTNAPGYLYTPDPGNPVFLSMLAGSFLTEPSGGVAGDYAVGDSIPFSEGVNATVYLPTIDAVLGTHVLASTESTPGSPTTTATFVISKI